MRSRWVAVATAPDQIIAETWAQLVRNEGCPCTTISDAIPFLGISATPVRLMAPQERADEARGILERFLGGGVGGDECRDGG